MMCPWFVLTMFGSTSLANKKGAMRFVRTVSSTSLYVPSMTVKPRQSPALLTKTVGCPTSDLIREQSALTAQESLKSHW
jgi:hypothetical protein